MKTRVIALVMATGLALLGTGCSSESDNPGPTTASTATTGAPGGGGQPGDTPDPCQLLTLAEISAQLGEEFTAFQELPAGGLPGQRTCSYVKGPDSGGMVNVGVWPFDPADVDSFIAQAGEVNQYDGLGDRAFGESHSLWVLSGNVMVNIIILFVDVETTDPILQLGLAAVGRL